MKKVAIVVTCRYRTEREINPSSYIFRTFCRQAKRGAGETPLYPSNQNNNRLRVTAYLSAGIISTQGLAPIAGSIGTGAMT